MRTLQEKLGHADNLVNEINIYFKVQTTYFESRDSRDLAKLRVQAQKVKECITKYKVG